DCRKFGGIPYKLWWHRPPQRPARSQTLAEDAEDMTMKPILLLFALSLSLAACGIKGDPEPPPSYQQAQ
ncbi:MAG: lipoprotein, partial [Alphaproteobacteria bacterium]|nr:lipoprotein [Alphaproteobacteria bacterium]